MVILKAIAVARDTGKELLVRPTDVIGDYIGYLYDSLVRRGYIKGNSSTGYQLTLKGRETLVEFLHQNRTRVKDTIKTLQQLGIEISQDIDKLGKEAMEVKLGSKTRTITFLCKIAAHRKRVNSTLLLKGLCTQH